MFWFLAAIFMGWVASPILGVVLIILTAIFLAAAISAPADDEGNAE